MQFSLAILALAGAAVAKAIPRDDEPAIVAVPNAPGTPDVGTGAITHLYICINSDFKGACTNLEVNTGGCYNLLGNWNDAVTSLGPDKGTTCTIWQDAGCSGRSLGNIVNPGIYNLADWNFNDIMSSLRCN
ncbi:hypothetical protein PG985_014033 [Apiospora marii]|uniref:Uncharacterized protein n=1 Tax=Apiospora marii TaxID=335849 RepID=A0ABR1R652_9PEZI